MVRSECVTPITFAAIPYASTRRTCNPWRGASIRRSVPGTPTAKEGKGTVERDLEVTEGSVIEYKIAGFETVRRKGKVVAVSDSGLSVLVAC